MQIFTILVIIIIEGKMTKKSKIFNRAGTLYQQPNKNEKKELAVYLSPSLFLSSRAFDDSHIRVKKSYGIKALKFACKEQGKRLKQELLQDAFAYAHAMQKKNNEARYHHFGKHARLLAVYDLNYLFKFFKLKRSEKIM